ncbi:malate synthase A [Usitatibacter palustris]|uniref:Malate synthase n=1 Tax=Usitatibacter palustris TaxID=2732487 RepID=A0A6M4HC81_9PROT|nr:malate synthase A [Usitatibacter palustris]QJR16852.1 Malate synthase A [Usitatibacter palustris]
MNSPLPHGMRITAAPHAEASRILTSEALAFVAKLHRAFAPRRKELLERRRARQSEFDAGVTPDFLDATKDVRNSEWRIAAQPKDLLDRRVEITGPTDRKMVINALNCGASTFMADFEDANCPTWANMIEGQANILDAVRRTITFQQGDKSYRLNERTAVLLPRPRGWHLDEKHVTVDGEAVSGGIFDFALLFFHNAKELLARGSGPYYYLPKIESHLEARLWNDIFTLAQKELDIPHGSIRATVLIETIPAAFEMDEILWELREHSAGLNIGRWDYIFSCIKKFRSHPEFCLADRAQVTMTSPFMRAYALLLVKTCHRRNAPAMGGMAAQIPIKNDAAANEAAMAKVRADKEREATDGCDGTWVAHPGLVPIAKEIFDRHMPGPNQYSKQRPDVTVTAKELLDFRPEAPITEAGLRNNVQVGIQYIGSWLAGNGCVPIFNLMEDAATAEISRSQVWQWMRSPKGVLDDGRRVTRALFHEILVDELKKTPGIVGAEAYAAGKYEEGAKLFEDISASDDYVEFLTLPAYQAID